MPRSRKCSARSRIKRAEGAGGGVVQHRLNVKRLEKGLDANDLPAVHEQHGRRHIGDVEAFGPLAGRGLLARRRDHRRVAPAVELHDTKALQLLECGRLAKDVLVQRIATGAILLFEEHRQRFATGLGQIVRRHLDENLVAGKHPDAVLAHAAGGVGDDFVALIELHAKGCVGQEFGDGSGQLDNFFLGH